MEPPGVGDEVGKTPAVLLVASLIDCGRDLRHATVKGHPLDQAGFKEG
jgi:hypothetical protein